MKKLLHLALYCSVLVLFQGCLKDKMTHTYTILTPIYKTKAEVYGNIKSNPSRNIQAPGKIFIYGHYIFLNEVDKGVHIIDNSNPAHPVVKAFVDIPGNLDIAVKGNTLYADMYDDLIAVDISNPLDARLLKTISGVFPERTYTNGFVADQGRVIVGWIRKDTTVQMKPSKDYIVYDLRSNTGGMFASASVPSPGVAGSMARFSIVNNYLYAVDHHSLKSISISNPNEPTLVGTINAGWDIETIYPFKDKLFLGSMGGVFIFDISNAAAPVRQGTFVHARACDPVVADDNYAYVTLRAGSFCGPAINSLEVIDIKNVSAPVLLKTYPMSNPKGLGKDNNLLFICDGTEGVKVYDAANVANLSLLKTISGMEANDVIAFNGVLLVSAKGGLYQYDYSNANAITYLSKITVSK